MLTGPGLGQASYWNSSAELFRARFRCLPFDQAAAEEYGRLRAYLEARGTPIGHEDTQTAAIALANDLTVVTGNVRHFQRVPGLAVENWLE